MPYFIKTEKFNNNAEKLLPKIRKQYLMEHKKWVKSLESKGIFISSGYLVDANQKPGGGGLLIFKAESYDAAIILIREDPMITNKLVEWDLKEWVHVTGGILN